jgi:hypothetical protein
VQDSLTENQNHRQPDQILQRTLLLTNDQKTQTYKHAGDSKTEHERIKTPMFAKPDLDPKTPMPTKPT